MTDFAAAATATVQGVQLALQVLYSLALTEWRYPANCAIVNGSSTDIIIVGGGTAGSILANRLSAIGSFNVLLLEAGGYAPIESDMVGLFPFLVSSAYEYNMTTVKNNRTMLKMKNQVMELTAGKSLGGTGTVDHLMHFHGNNKDFDDWARIIGDDSWNSTNIKPYMKKIETLTDPELINSEYASLHGTSGPIKIARQKNPVNNKIMESFKELGHRVVPDLTSDTSTVGVTEPLYEIHNNVRQSSAISYLGETLPRKNLCVALYTTVTKILIEDQVAVGVQAVDSDGNVIEVYATKEVIISAGGINTPKILMLSGIGPKAHLEANNITTVADLPVGKNYQDQISLALLYLLDDKTLGPFNPFQFPAPVVAVYGAANRSQTYPNYGGIILQFSKNSSSLLQVCTHVIKFNNDVCNEYYKASANRSSMLVVFGLTIPKSRGYIELASSDYKDDPLVYPEFYTDSEGKDLEMMVESVIDFHNVTNTKYFKSVNVTFVDLNLCPNATTDEEFWRCYALEMSFGMWHYVGTSAMGSCLDGDFNVYNITNLRVVDGSAMPTEVSGKPRATISMMAEKAADSIMSKHNVTV